MDGTQVNLSQLGSVAETGFKFGLAGALGGHIAGNYLREMDSVFAGPSGSLSGVGRAFAEGASETIGNASEFYSEPSANDCENKFVCQ